MIEAVTYRMGGHSTSDDPTKYRNEEEVEIWKKKDPILRFRIYLTRKGLLTEQEDQKMHEQTEAEIVNTIKSEERVPPPPISTLFTDVYAEVPWHIKEEMDEATGEEASR